MENHVLTQHSISDLIQVNITLVALKCFSILFTNETASRWRWFFLFEKIYGNKTIHKIHCHQHQHSYYFKVLTCYWNVNNLHLTLFMTFSLFHFISPIEIKHLDHILLEWLITDHKMNLLVLCLTFIDIWISRTFHFQ